MDDIDKDVGRLDRRVLRLSGEDVRGFLQGLVTQDMDLVRPGTPQWAGLLSPQGKALFDFILWADGEDILIDAEGTQVDALARRLTLYRLRRPITIAVDDALTVGWLVPHDGPLADEPDARSARHVANLAAQPETLTIAPDPRLARLGWRILTYADLAIDMQNVWRRFRLANDVVEGVDELGSDKILWLECNAAELNGVSFTKGCYIGQENTARMNWRNKVNRRLVVVPLSVAEDKRVTMRYPELDMAVQHVPVTHIDPMLASEWLWKAISGEER